MTRATIAVVRPSTAIARSEGAPRQTSVSASGMAAPGANGAEAAAPAASEPASAPCNGNPQCGQLTAAGDTSPAHSGQGTRAIGPPRYHGAPRPEAQNALHICPANRLDALLKLIG